MRTKHVVALVVLVMGTAACDDDNDFPNISPSAYADAARIRPGQPAELDVLANDGDPDGGLDSLTIEIVTQPANATAIVSGRRVRFSPQSGFLGRTTFEYRARDASGATSAPALVTIDVTPLGRVLLAKYSASTPLETWYVADTAGVTTIASNPLTCNQSHNFARNASGSQVVIMTCGSEYWQHNLVSVRGRESPVWTQEILRNTPLHGNLVVSDDGSRVVALQYDFDPNSGADPSNFQLLVVDTGTGTVLQRMPINGVATVYGLTGAGPARTIFLQVSDNSTGTPHPAILTADLDSGTLSRLETANPYNVLIEESMAYANGDGLLFRYADARLYALDSLSPETLQIPWEDPDATMYPVDTIQGTADAVVYRYPYTSSAYTQEFWVVPLRNPTARRRIVAGVAIAPSVAISPDGQRMLMASSPLASLHSFVQEVSLTDGALLRSPGPPGGIELLRYFQYLGSEGDLLVSTDDINTYERLSVIRHDDPQTLAPVATDLDYYGVVYREIDADGTGIAISVALAGNGGYARAFLCDANLPGRSVPLNAPAADDDGVFVVGALGAPLP